MYVREDLQLLFSPILWTEAIVSLLCPSLSAVDSSLIALSLVRDNIVPR